MFIIARVSVRGGAGDKRLVDRTDPEQPKNLKPGSVMKGHSAGDSKRRVQDPGLTSPRAPEREREREIRLHSNHKQQLASRGGNEHERSPKPETQVQRGVKISENPGKSQTQALLLR